MQCRFSTGLVLPLRETPSIGQRKCWAACYEPTIYATFSPSRHSVAKFNGCSIVENRFIHCKGQFTRVRSRTDEETHSLRPAYRCATRQFAIIEVARQCRLKLSTTDCYGDMFEIQDVRITQVRIMAAALRKLISQVLDVIRRESTDIESARYS